MHGVGVDAVIPQTGDQSIGYVCGALKVSTRDDSPSIGPRAHVVGFLDALQRSQSDVRIWLAGDERAGRAATTSRSTSADSLRSSRVRRLAVDSARMALRFGARRRAQWVIGRVGMLYERQATFHDLGRPYQRMGIPWVIESNGPFWYEASHERKNLEFVAAAKRIEIQAYRDADVVVVVSEHLRDILMRETGRAESHFLVLPNATDGNRFNPSTQVAERHSSDFTVGFAGYLTEWAGIDLLLDAVSARRAQGSNISVTLAGDGPAEADLRRQAQRLGIADHVAFLGRVPWSRMPAILAGFDFAYSGQRSMRIGSMYHSPQKLYEYQSMGLPIIASDHPDARSLIRDGQTGFLFASENAASLAEAMRGALGLSREERSAMGYRARTQILGENTWDVRIAHLIDELARRGVRPCTAGEQV